MSERRRGAPTELLLTCEHADHRIPRPYAALFVGAADVLASHRGWDPGAWRLARLLARRLDRPLLVTRWSRLLVESNRSPANPRIWSRFTADLSRDERRRVLDRYWWPHRRNVEAAIAAGSRKGRRVVHVAVHTFAPALDGVTRNADVGILYDSTRSREVALARRWRARLREHDPALRVRYNYPYRGSSDGLTTWLRRRHPAARYLGMELEVNQALATGPGWRRVGEILAEALHARADASPAAAKPGTASTRPA